MAFRRQQKATPKDGIHTAIDSFARILGKSEGTHQGWIQYTELKYFA